MLEVVTSLCFSLLSSLLFSSLSLSLSLSLSVLSLSHAEYFVL